MSRFERAAFVGVITAAIGIATSARAQSCAFQILQGSQTGSNDQFGSALDARGELAIVAANGEAAYGAAYVFERTGGSPNGWNEIRRIGAEGLSNFGAAVSISGDTAVVGQHCLFVCGRSFGTVHIFDRNEGGPDAWGEVGHFAPEGTDNVGRSVSIDGDYLAIGSMDPGLHIVERDQGGPNNWGAAAGNYGAFGGDDFGSDIALRGTTLLVGSADANDHIGRVFAFDRMGDSGWQNTATIEAPIQFAHGHFGEAIALDGERAAISAPAEGGIDNEGSVFIFARRGQEWLRTATIVPVNETTDEMSLFGRDVALHGQYLAVSARLDNGDANGAAVYLFHEDEGGPGNWGQVTRLVVNDITYGWAIASGENRLIIGQRGANESGHASGAAYVYESLPETDCNSNGVCDSEDVINGLDCDGNDVPDSCDLAEDPSLDCNANGVLDECDINGHSSADVNSNGVPDECTAYAEASCDFVRRDGFGAPVAIDGNRALARARGTESVAVLRPAVPGALHTWEQVTTLGPGEGATALDFGAAVALDGEVAVVGDPTGSNVPTSESVCGGGPGFASVFVRVSDEPEAWTESAQLHASDFEPGSWFGGAVAASGDTIVVGAEFDGAEQTEPIDAGAAYVFERDAHGAWFEVRKLVASDATAYSRFGDAVAIDGSTAVVGSSEHGTSPSYAGAAYVFERDVPTAGAWGEVAHLTAAVAETNARFGGAVAISGDLIAVGASSEGAGFGCSNGAVYLFGRNESGPGAWGLITTLLPPQPDCLAAFGSAIAISGDLMLIGAPGRDVTYLYRNVSTDPADWRLVAAFPALDYAPGSSFGEAAAIDGVLGLLPAAGAESALYILNTQACVQCPGDIDGNGEVGFGDVIHLLMEWSACAPPETCAFDVNGDGELGFADLTELLLSWGPCVPGPFD